MFEWDNEIVNAETYRRAMNHARERADAAAKHDDRDEKLESLSYIGTEDSSDRLSVMESLSLKPTSQAPPYEMSVVSEPLYMEQNHVLIPNSSMSDKPSSRMSLLSYRSKNTEGGKKSFWSTVSGKRNSRNPNMLQRNGTPESVLSRASTPGTRRGRRGFESSYHTSIDFGSEDGLSAPPIVRAAQAGSVVEVEKLLDQRADISARHVQSGRSALSVASHCGNVEVVRLLLRYGASVDELDVSSFSALHLASLRGHVDVVELLLQEHADIDIKGPNERTALRIASEKGQLEVAEVLLRKKAKVNARDQNQMTPLHVAAKHGDVAMTSLLANHGAHVEAKDSNFMGAIHYACEGGHHDVISVLLSHKADIEAHGKASMTPLLCASAAGKANVAEFLLKKKASLKHRGEGDMTALHWASFNGHVEVIDLLLQKKAPINTTNKDGRTPLHLAVLADEFAVADLLLRKGAAIESQCKSGSRPLHYACTQAKPEITQLLIGYNANVEAEDGSRNRPLHKACNRGSLPHVELLIKKGVNIEARTMTGDRPLCLASSFGHVDIVRRLLDRGAAIRSKFTTGPSHEDSPLCLAAKCGHVPVVEELLKRGASVLQKDERDWQPLRYAAFHAHPAVVEVLLKHGATVSGSASGGWGFEITAHRIGFANDMSIQERRKAEVLRLLTDAESREQKSRERITVSTHPVVPPAVQNQTVPMELPDPNVAKSPVQGIQAPIVNIPTRPTSEMQAEPPQSPRNSTKDEYARYLPQTATIQAGALDPYAPLAPSELPPTIHYLNPNAIHAASTHPHQAPMPAGQIREYPTNLPTNLPIPGPSMGAAAIQSPVSYTFTPKPVPQSPQLYSYGPPLQSSAAPNLNNSTASFPTQPNMTLGPDGLWRQTAFQFPSVQKMPSQHSVKSTDASLINLPAGVYEMSS